MKKSGVIGIVIVALWAIAVIITINKSNYSFFTDTSLITSLLLPLAALTLGYYQLNNIEHVVVSILFFLIAALSTVAIAVNAIMPSSNEFITKIYSTQLSINTYSFIILYPFLIRTQSKTHRAFKYLNFLFILVAAIILYILNNGSNQSINSLELLIKVEVYVVIIAVALSAANPIIGYGTCDGLGGGSKSSSMPKLVPVNQATNPNLAGPNTITTGINYGNNPVPNGVVATPNPIAPAPVITPVAEPVAPVVSTPVEQTPSVEPQIIPETLDTPVESLAPAPTAVEQPAPPQTLTAEEVAPELQFLINNDK